MYDPKLYTKNDDELEGLLKTVKKFSDEIGMEFGFNKCAKVSFKREKLVSISLVELNVDTVIKEIKHEQVYKYLGVDEKQGIKNANMKEKKTEILLSKSAHYSKAIVKFI